MRMAGKLTQRPAANSGRRDLATSRSACLTTPPFTDNAQNRPTPDHVNRDREQVLFATDGVELVRHADGRRELRLTDCALNNLEAAFDAIVAALWFADDPRVS